LSLQPGFILLQTAEIRIDLTDLGFIEVVGIPSGASWPARGLSYTHRAFSDTTCGKRREEHSVGSTVPK